MVSAGSEGDGRPAESDGDRIGAELPADLSGVSLLEVVQPGVAGVAADVFADRGAEEIVVSERPGELLEEAEGRFGVVICRDPLRTCPFPMALLGDLWRLTAPDGVLLFEAEIVTEPELARYARFVPATGAGAGWVPGRLTLRWMLEVSGFDVERWLEEPETEIASRASLRASRAAREPARSAP